MNFAIDNCPRRLEESFERKGIQYQRVDAAPAYFIYSAKMPDAPRIWFEVFQRRINKAYRIADKDIPASEAWPTDSAFGSWAWTYDSLIRAQERAATILPHSSSNDP